MLVLLAIFVDKFDTWMSWVAGVAANSIAFILPALFYICCAKFRGGWWTLAIISMCVGCVSLVLNVFSNILKVVQG